VRVCAQHHNGGAAVDANWQTTVPGLYCVGEAAGSFGAYRPGGSALNATQVGSMRAAQHIVYESTAAVPESPEDFRAQAEEALDAAAAGDAVQLGKELRSEMSCAGAHMRDLAALDTLEKRLENSMNGQGAVTEASIRLHDQMITQRALISAIRCAADIYGSTGAGLVLDENGALPIHALGLRAREHQTPDVNQVICTEGFTSFAVPARPIPQGEHVFENAWRQFRQRREKGVRT